MFPCSSNLFVTLRYVVLVRHCGLNGLASVGHGRLVGGPDGPWEGALGATGQAGLLQKCRISPVACHTDSIGVLLLVECT